MIGCSRQPNQKLSAEPDDKLLTYLLTYLLIPYGVEPSYLHYFLSVGGTAVLNQTMHSVSMTKNGSVKSTVADCWTWTSE